MEASPYRFVPTLSILRLSCITGPVLIARRLLKDHGTLPHNLFAENLDVELSVPCGERVCRWVHSTPCLRAGLGLGMHSKTT